MPSYKYQTSKGATRWFCSFYAHDLITGRNHKVKKSGFTLKRDADQYERDYLARHSSIAANMTFGQVAENYLADLAQRKKARTAVNLRSSLNVHILPAFAGLPIAAITPAQIRALQNQLLAANLGRSTLKTALSALSSVFAFAASYYALSPNPCELAGKPALPPAAAAAAQKHVHFWTLEQFQKFVTSALDPEYLLLFSILYWTGARLGEALALTLQDFNIEKEEIRINKALSYVPPQKFIIQSPKTAASVRDIVLPHHITLMLQDWAHLTDMKDPADMFFDIRYIQVVESYFLSHAKAAALPIIRVHDLRHSHASLLIRLGLPPVTVAKRLGHADVKTTLSIYSHLYPQAQAELQNLLDNANV